MTPLPDSVSSGVVGQAVSLRRYPGIRRLAADYSDGADRLLEFYAGHPTDARAWRQVIERAQAHPRERVGLCDALMRQLQRRAAPPEARAAVERLRDPDSVVVVTGQQAGLFGGPLYTLLKAITALKLAARIRQDFRVPTEAVFWIDSEDHDWNEVNGCEVLDTDLQPTTISLPNPAGAGELPVARVMLDANVSACVDRLAEILPPTEFTGSLLTKIRSAYRQGYGMSEAFGRWLEFVLGEFGLIVYDAADPATKPLVGRIFAREAAFAGRTAELAAEAGQRLVALGYHAQVLPTPGHVSMFHLDGGRHPIGLDDGRFVVDGHAVDLTTLAALASSTPAAFSPNVLLRPIVQDALFPTIAYVAGPNELAYLGQLKAVYADFGVPMPLMYPRASATLLDSAGVRFLAKYSVPLEDLHARDESTLNRLLESQLPPAVDQALQDADSTIEQRMQVLIEALPTLDPTLEGAARSVAGRLRHELQGLHTKIIHAAKKRNETLRRQFGRTQAQAFPAGHAQERSTGFVYFLNRYGPALIDRLMSDLPIDPGSHWILTI
ncbi:MAG: bacillithiol biosynthesis cysteine-adding enzyme BshC [Acidobacteria bacterium]|nr:bacillithiol biosynthesis cysteine-adding enzyme BshC [Acidobacteriota bacterium]